MVEVSTTFHRYQLPHQANYRAWGRSTATTRGGHKRSMVPIYVLAGTASAPFIASGPGRAAAAMGASSLTQPLPSDNLFFIATKDPWVRGGAGAAGLYGMYLGGQWLHEKYKEGYTGPKPPWWNQSKGGSNSQSSQQSGGRQWGKQSHPPWAPSRRLGRSKSGSTAKRGRRWSTSRVSRPPYCPVHKSRHWCWFTRKNK